MDKENAYDEYQNLPAPVKPRAAAPFNPKESHKILLSATAPKK